MRLLASVLSLFMLCTSAVQAAELVHGGRLVFGNVGGFTTEFVMGDVRLGLKFESENSSFTLGGRSVAYGLVSTVVPLNYWYAEYETGKLRLTLGAVDPAGVGSGIEKIGTMDPCQATLQSLYLGPMGSVYLLLNSYKPSVRADYAIGTAHVAVSYQQGSQFASVAVNRPVGQFDVLAVLDKHISTSENFATLGLWRPYVRGGGSSLPLAYGIASTWYKGAGSVNFTRASAAYHVSERLVLKGTAEYYSTAPNPFYELGVRYSAFHGVSVIGTLRGDTAATAVGSVYLEVPL